MSINRFTAVSLALTLGIGATVADAHNITRNIYRTDINSLLTIRDINYEQSILIRDPRILDDLFHHHSLGRKLSDLAYFMRITTSTDKDFERRASFRNLNFRDTASFIFQNAFYKSDCQLKEHNDIVRNVRQQNYSSGAPHAPLSTTDNVKGDNTLSLHIGVDTLSTITPYRHVMELWNDKTNGLFDNLINDTDKECEPREPRWPNNPKSSKQVRLSMCTESQYNAEFNNKFAGPSICYDKTRVGHGPFRLLAVVNRMDKAGDNQITGNRANLFAGNSPRALGELQLIYGLVDPDYERRAGKPYPTTFQVTYRLPMINANYSLVHVGSRNNHTAFQNENTAHRNHLAPENITAWRTQMQRWAKLWQQLSRLNFDSATDRTRASKHLNALLLDIARPENFLNLNMNTLINGKYDTRERKIVARTGGLTNELKMYYNNANMDALNSARTINDPYRCVVNSDYFRNYVNNYHVDHTDNSRVRRDGLLMLGRWDGNSFDTMNYDTRMSTGDPKSGYNLDARTGAATPSWHYRTPTDLPGCTGSVNGISPWEHIETKQSQLYKAHIRPFFARTNNSFEWSFSDSRELTNVSEATTHDFAMRTCSGCHGRETGTNGFHVENRLEGRTAPASKFTRRFKYKTPKNIRGSKQYFYPEKHKRRNWLYNAANNPNWIKHPTDMWYRTGTLQ